MGLWQAPLPDRRAAKSLGLNCMGGCEQSRGDDGGLHTPSKAESLSPPHGTTPGHPDAFPKCRRHKARRSIWKGTAAVGRDLGA